MRTDYISTKRGRKEGEGKGEERETGEGGVGRERQEHSPRTSTPVVEKGARRVTGMPPVPPPAPLLASVRLGAALNPQDTAGCVPARTAVRVDEPGGE